MYVCMYVRQVHVMKILYCHWTHVLIFAVELRKLLEAYLVVILLKYEEYMFILL